MIPLSFAGLSRVAGNDWSLRTPDIQSGTERLILTTGEEAVGFGFE